MLLMAFRLEPIWRSHHIIAARLRFSRLLGNNSRNNSVKAALQDPDVPIRRIRGCGSGAFCEEKISHQDRVCWELETLVDSIFPWGRTRGHMGATNLCNCGCVQRPYRFLAGQAHIGTLDEAHTPQALHPTPPHPNLHAHEANSAPATHFNASEHLSIFSAKYRPTSFQVARGLHRNA